MHSITKKDPEFILNSTHDGMIAVNEEGIVNLFNRAAETISEKVIGHEHLPLLECEKIMSSQVDSPEPVKSLRDIVEEAEKSAIIRALKVSGGNREKAAGLLGIALRNLYYKIKKYDIQ
jgi:transcriptional regulator with PAS, ATPase and Fis domain